uniref:Uncharacterized protein n=1 Tax=Avena sativa TaxID=4498 RepID=A0ACD5UI30_AVESA
MATGKEMMSPLTDLSDHILAEIFLLLPAAEDLARASAACVSFRRLVTDRSFLRRFRRLHAPPLLGFLDRDGFHPAVPPHPSAPAARALSVAADFTFSFLPSNCRWAVRDVRDGRVLLDRQLEEGEDLPVFTQLVVCDPVHRRYILLPPVPDELAASVKDPVPIFFGCICDPVLIPPSEEEEMAAAEETAFRVIWLARCKIKFYIFVFSSSTGHWRVAASQSLTDLLGESTTMTLTHPWFIGCYHACGCIYWQLLMDNSGTEFLVLDTKRMEFSIAQHPPKGWNTGGLGIVEAGEDRLGMFRIIAETAEADLRYIIGGNRGLSSTQWQAEKTISLDSKYRYCVEASSGRYLLLDRRKARSYENYSLDGPQMEYFSLDVETLQLERVWGKPISGTSLPHLYINFPPSLLSSPTV